MHYVYILQSINSPDEYYTGITADLKKRLEAHNHGQSPHTAKHRPWRLVSYVAFADEAKAQAFEKYLKSGSGRAFAAKRLR
ncbi:GIY-YIG nuclease family protein [Alterisphingorhabdus coralli]|uniref:GIY-YIG nuclease family protein n=1 Tax=Alterisphingorhabdus coralli TaxID=3071408 RepID=A0AA97F7Z4_9SPHN|nr:GIY-YIG nuclease family protein [Parasphingorhabdus sp. SCSIO 66989]WOE74962.1 GIY-YIG nuclease family protein [Parasphingorhabdus sp. SCSIO 66989]